MKARIDSAPSDRRWQPLCCGSEFLHAFFHVFGGDVFDVGGDAPEVSEGVLDEAGAVAVELVLDGLEEFGSVGGGALDDFVDIGEVDVEADGAAADGGGAGVSGAHAGVLVGEHNAGGADLELGVADFAVGAGHAHDFGGAEDVLVVVDGAGGSIDDEVRGDGVVVLGNVRDFGHDVLLWVMRLEVKFYGVQARAAIRFRWS